MGTKSRVKPTDEERMEFQAVLTELRKILKDRKISYKELAQKMRLSESGTKKIFAGHDCSFVRLSQICRVLGFKLSDLLDEMDRGESKRVQFTADQQKCFFKDMRLFRFFIKLAIERQSIKHIQKEFALSEKEIFKLLKRLDEIGLIQLHPGNKVKLPGLKLVKSFGEGPLLEKLYQDWGREIVGDLAYPKYQATGQFIVRTLSMKEETYKELLSRLLALEEEFLKRSVREMSVAGHTLRPARWMWLTDAQSFVRGKL